MTALQNRLLPHDPLFRVEWAISAIEKPFAIEAGLQAEIGRRLRAANIPYDREVETGRGPVDFAVGGIAIEVKVAGSALAVSRQVSRYLQGPRFTSLFLVTTKPLQLPLLEVETPQGLKPVRLIELWRNYL